VDPLALDQHSPPSSYEQGWEGYNTILRLLHLTVPPPLPAMSGSRCMMLIGLELVTLPLIPLLERLVKAAPPNQSSKNPQVFGGVVGPLAPD
jgi:hypothetical protein